LAATAVSVSCSTRCGWRSDSTPGTARPVLPGPSNQVEAEAAQVADASSQGDGRARDAEPAARGKLPLSDRGAARIEQDALVPRWSTRYTRVSPSAITHTPDRAWPERAHQLAPARWSPSSSNEGGNRATDRSRASSGRHAGWRHRRCARRSTLVSRWGGR
jgi:hypothetical protein